MISVTHFHYWQYWLGMRQFLNFQLFKSCLSVQSAAELRFIIHIILVNFYHPQYINIFLFSFNFVFVYLIYIFIHATVLYCKLTSVHNSCYNETSSKNLKFGISVSLFQCICFKTYCKLPK